MTTSVEPRNTRWSARCAGSDSSKWYINQLTYIYMNESKIEDSRENFTFPHDSNFLFC
jgi:hypothetical protein